MNKKQTMVSKELVKEIHRHILSIFILTDPPMTFLSACGFSSTGAGGGALCASASVMLAAVKLHFHSEIPPSESSHNFSSSSFELSPDAAVVCHTTATLWRDVIVGP